MQIASIAEGSVDVKSASGDVRIGVKQGSRLFVDAKSLSGDTTSEVELGGDLEVTGRGVIGCDIRVLGDVSIESEGSSLRGGLLSFGGVARIAELGSVGEALTLVRLGPLARLYAGIVHPGVSVDTHGGEPVVFAQVERGVELCGLPAAA